MTAQDEVRGSIEALLAETHEATLERERTTLAQLLAECRQRVVVFGAGSTGRRTLTCLRSIGVEPLALADNGALVQGKVIDGLTVLSAGDAAERYGRDALFIVAIWNAKHWYHETAAQLAKLGCNFVAPIGPVYWRFADTFLPFFVVDLPHKVLAARDEVRRASAIWSDEQSRSEYLAHVRWRTHGDAAGLPARPAQESYFADDIFELSADEALVDCGAYDGDTIRGFVARCGDEFRHVDAIEPSPATCDLLREFVATLRPQTQRNIHIYQCAVGAERGHVRFDPSCGVDSHISDEGAVVVELQTLDALCGNSRPTFVKMDIEGAEYDALLGARQIIRDFRPILAVCLEHRQDDIWRLPLLMHDMEPQYRMYLRTYEGDGWQSVAYAVPSERVKPTEPAVR